jgi:putative tryptophan/tyrosine transport system substrate-binding protein
MKRRELLGSAGTAAIASALPRGLLAQPRSSLRLGLVAVTGLVGGNYDIFRGRMAELGYVEGRNFTFELVTIERPADYEAAYTDLVKRGMDILLAVGSEQALGGARQAAANRVPVVFLAVDYDPAQIGYVASLARPGGNLTGFFVHQSEQAARRIEVARELLPKAKRFALWWDSPSRAQAEVGQVAAKSLGVAADLIGVSGRPPDFETAFRLGTRLNTDAVILSASPAYLEARTEIVKLALRSRVPLIAAFRQIVEAGGLVSYGVSLQNVFRDMADCVDRIAHGTKPADLPIQRPSKFELAVNLVTAKALDLTVPQSLLARADTVIK